MLWNLVQSSEMMAFCTVVYGRLPGWSATRWRNTSALLIVTLAVPELSNLEKHVTAVNNKVLIKMTGDLEVVKKELAPFLSPSAKEHAKSIAIEHVLGLTGAPEGIKLIGDSEGLLQGLVSLTDDKQEDIQEKAYKCLINLSTEETIAIRTLKLEKYETKCVDWLKNVLNPEFKLADIVCQLLSNLTRAEEGAKHVAEKVLESNETSIDKIVLVLCNLTYNQNAELHYLASMLSNLSQIKDVRHKIMDKDQCIIQRLLPFTEFRQSAVRRHGIVGTLKNCCFDTEYHDWLLSDDVDLLPRLLLPLAGPEEFDDDDVERLPEDLQYLPPDKEREPNPRIRKMLVEALLQLCATRKGRQFLKAKNTYIIMREYYAWERKKEPVNETAALNLIDVLIGDEPSKEMGENLKDLEIPVDIQEKFHKEDELEKQQSELEQQQKELELQTKKELEHQTKQELEHQTD